MKINNKKFILKSCSLHFNSLYLLTIPYEMTYFDNIVASVESSTPSNDVYTIFSKENCPWCVSAKELLSENDEIFTYVDCTSEIAKNRDHVVNTLSRLSGVQIKTFPVIFKGKRYIGGFQDLRKSF